MRWNHVAICILITGAIGSIGAISLLPISMASAGSALPIVFGEVWSGWLLPHTKLNQRQWSIIFCIVFSVAGVAFFGDHTPKPNVMDDFLDNVWTYHGFSWLIATVSLAVICLILIFFTPMPTNDIHTCSVVNIIGPLLPGAVGNFTQICVRIGAVALLCVIQDCGEEYPYFIYFLGALIPMFAITQLHFLGIVMAKLNLTTAIPLYQSSLIILPALSGIFLLNERPSNIPGYVGCLVLSLTCLAVFIREISLKDSEEAGSEELSIEESNQKDISALPESSDELEVEDERNLLVSPSPKKIKLAIMHQISDDALAKRTLFAKEIVPPTRI